MKSGDEQPSSSHAPTSLQETVSYSGEACNFLDDECPNCASAKEACRRAMFQCFNLSNKLRDFERLKPENEELLQRVGNTDKYVLELLGKYDEAQSSVCSLQTQLDAALVREKDSRQQIAILEGKQEQFDEAVRKASNNQEKLHRITNAANQVRQKAEEQYQTIDKLNEIIQTEQKTNDDLKKSLQKLEAEKSLWKSQMSSGKKYLPTLFEVINELACAESFPHLSLKIRKKIDKIKQSEAQMILLGTSGRIFSDDEAARNLEMLMLNDPGSVINRDQNTLLDNDNFPSSSFTRKEYIATDNCSKKRGQKDVGRGKASKPQTMDINILNQNAEIALQKKVNRSDALQDSGVSISTIHGRKLPSVKEQQKLSNALSVKERVKLMREKLDKGPKEFSNKSSHVSSLPLLATTHTLKRDPYCSSSLPEDANDETFFTASYQPSDSETILELVQSLVNKTADGLSQYALQIKPESTNKARDDLRKISIAVHANRNAATGSKDSLKKAIANFLQKLGKEIEDPLGNISCWSEIVKKLSSSTHAVSEPVHGSIPIEKKKISLFSPQLIKDNNCESEVTGQNDSKEQSSMVTFDNAESISPSLDMYDDLDEHIPMDGQLPETSNAKSSFDKIDTEQNFTCERHDTHSVEQADNDLPNGTSSAKISLRSHTVVKKVNISQETNSSSRSTSNTDINVSVNVEVANQVRQLDEGSDDHRVTRMRTRRMSKSSSENPGSPRLSKTRDATPNKDSLDATIKPSISTEVTNETCQFHEDSLVPRVTRSSRAMSKSSSKKSDPPKQDVYKSRKSTSVERSLDATFKRPISSDAAKNMFQLHEDSDTSPVTRRSRAMSKSSSKQSAPPRQGISKTRETTQHRNSLDATVKPSISSEVAKQTCQLNEVSDTPRVKRSSRGVSKCSSEKPDPPMQDINKSKKATIAKEITGKQSKRKLDLPEIHKVDSLAFKAAHKSSSRRLSVNPPKSMVPSVSSTVGPTKRFLRSSTSNANYVKKVPEPLLSNDSTTNVDEEPGTLMIIDENINTDKCARTETTDSQNDNVNSLIGHISSEDEDLTSKEIRKNLPSTSSGMLSVLPTTSANKRILPITSVEKRSFDRKTKVSSIRDSLQSGVDRRADLKTLAARLTKQMNNQIPKAIVVSSFSGKRNPSNKISVTEPIGPSAMKSVTTTVASSNPLKRKFGGPDVTIGKKVCTHAEIDGSILKSERLLDAVISLSSAEIDKLPTERLEAIHAIEPAEFVEAFCMFLLKRSAADHWFFIDNAFKKKVSKSEIHLHNNEEAAFLQNAVTLISFNQSLLWFPLARELVKVINCRSSVLHTLYARVIRITAHCLRFNRTLDAGIVPEQVNSLLQSLFLDIIDRNDAGKIMVFFLICFDQADISFVATGEFLNQLRLLSDTSTVLSWAFKLAFPDLLDVTLDANVLCNSTLEEENILNNLESNSFVLLNDGKVEVSEKLCLSVRNYVQFSVKAYFHQNNSQRRNMREKWTSNLRNVVDELRNHYRNPCGTGEIFADSVTSAEVLEERRSWRLACTLHMITAIFVDLFSLGNEGKSFITGISDQLMPCLSMVREIRISIKHAESNDQIDIAAGRTRAIVEYALKNFCKFCQRLTRFPIEP